MNRLSFKVIPKGVQGSHFDWMNIDLERARVGKVRGLVEGRSLTICSITIFPEFQRHGYARATIAMLKRHFDMIVADRVRFAAIEFWRKMGFSNHGGGTWVFEI